VRDVKSLISIGNNDLGDKDTEGSVLGISKCIEKETGKEIDKFIMWTLPGDAFRNVQVVDWIMANKEEDTDETYNDLLM